MKTVSTRPSGFSEPLVGVVSLALAACAGEPPPTVLEAPAEPLYVAAISLEDDVPQTASALVRWVPGTGLPLFVNREQDHLIVAFGEDQLRGLGPLDEARISETRLRLSVGCEPPLPTPIWRARWEAGQSAPVLQGPDTPIPPLTADWMADRCETVGDDRWMVETSCNPFGVFPTVNRTDSPCERQLTLTNYMLPTLRVRQWYDGRVCTEPETQREVCERDPVAPEVVDCGGAEPCRITAGVSELADPPFTSITRQLYPDAAPYVDRVFETDREYRSLRTRYGRARAFAVLSDSVWIAATSSVVEDCPRRRTTYREFELRQLSRSDLSPIRTATAPSCVEEMLADEVGGFFLAYSEDEQNWIARYDGEGRRTETRRLGGGDVDPVSNVQMLQIRELMWTPTGELLVVMTDDVTRIPNDRPSILLMLDASTLEERGRIDTLARAKVTQVLFLDDARAVVAFHGTNALEYVNVAQRTVERRVPFEHDPGLGTHGLARIGSTLALAGQNVMLLFDAETGRELGRAPVSARPMTVIHPIIWPNEPRALFVLGLPLRSDSPYVSLGSFLDVDARRFRPTVFELGGFGVPHQVTPDGEGGFLVLQSWNGEITKLTPKSGI